MTTDDLPALNAVLNGASAVCLALGYGAIRKKRIGLHLTLMLAAFTLSCLFLVSYVTHKLNHPVLRFSATGWIRPVYFTLLGSHTLLAAAILPLACMTLYRGLRRRHPAHERIARWTLPIWFYVSVTGVVIYFLLYHVYPGTPAA